MCWPQILKVVPYSAIQLCSYEAAKRHLRNKDTGDLSVPARLAAGAFAGMTATLVQLLTSYFPLSSCCPFMILLWGFNTYWSEIRVPCLACTPSTLLWHCSTCSGLVSIKSTQSVDPAFPQEILTGLLRACQERT